MTRLALDATRHCLTGRAIGEVVGLLVVVIVPGGMAAGLGDALFWGSLALGLVIAFAVASPVNRWLIARGRGHAIVHGAHS